ncbi:nuclease-related domain-containing protein, partial [Acinetobacter baumannii]
SFTLPINEFRTNLERYYKNKGIKTNLFDNIRVIEYLYRQILEDRIKILGKYNSEDIIHTQFSLINYLYHQILKHTDTIKEKEYKYFENLMNAKSEYFNGDDLDKHIEELSKVFYMTLMISSYENNWFNKKSHEAIIPYEIFNKNKEKNKLDEEIKISEELVFNTGFWDITEDIDFKLRFFKDEIVIENGKIYYTNKIWEELGNYALIAKIRQQRMLAQKTFEASAILYNFGLKDSVKLNYLSLQAQFEDLYYVDIEKDNIQYKNLTLKEWIKSLLAFKEIVKNEGFNLISFDQFFKVLQKHGIPTSKNRIVLENFTFRSNSKDLYNNPILRFSNNQILIFPLTMLYPDIITILNSILSENNLAIKDKGYDFENYVFNYLLEKSAHLDNFNVTQPKFKNKDGEFQYDVLIEWENYIFIIECKNRSIPNTTAMSLKDFREKSNEYIKQILRLKEGLLNHPRQHNINLNNKIIVPILLNSLPFSLDYSISDIYFLDLSCFSAFFNNKNLYLQSSFQGKIQKERIVHTNWSSDKPSVDDFLNFIKSPFHVSQLKSCLREHITFHTIGNYEIALERKYFDLHSEEYEKILEVKKNMH